jgi:hypothetical protein
MTRLRASLALVAAALVLVAGSARAGSKLRGWVTRIDERARTIEVDGMAIPLRSLAVKGGPLEPGAFVKVEKGGSSSVTSATSTRSGTSSARRVTRRR